jgi:diguanylate cyclase (GGDEF)-like protein/PAS domain S-box-containing protein
MENIQVILKSILDTVDDGIYFVDRERRITVWNTAAEKISGYAQNEIVGHFCYENLLNHVDKEGNLLCKSSCPLFATMVDGRTRNADVLLRHKNGYRVPVSVRTIPAYNHGKIVGAVEVFTKKAALSYDDDFVASLTNIAMKDPLTGLPNRAYLENQIKYKLQESAWYGKEFCVVVADIDDLRLFNNYYRTSTGDVALQSIASSFKYNIGEWGRDIIGRWGDDEFVGIFELHPNVNPLEIAEYVRILILRSGVMISGQYLSLSASVGLTAAQRGESADSLVARAEDLMYQSKNKGKNCSTVYVPANIMAV